MIKIKSLKWKNFLSYGNNWTEFHFKEGINFISGVSGSGKSTLTDLLYFVLFGKPYRKINIANLINSINKKNLLVYLEFEKNNKKYVIKRGLKPNIFEIYENGKLIDIAAHKTKYQRFLEEKILEFDENYFNQIIVKSLTKKISIFNFTKEEKRQLIDELFELQYITELKNKSKEILLKLKSDLKIEENNLSNLKQLIYQEEENIKKLKEIEENLKKEKEEKIKQIEKEIKNTTIEIENIDKNLIEINKLKDEYEKLKVTYKELSKEIKKIVEEKMKIEIEYNHSKDLYNKFYPVCKDCPKLKIITNFETYTEDDILKLKEKIEKLENEQNEIKTKIQNIKSFLNTEKILKNKKEILKQTIRKLEKEKIEIEKKNIDIEKSNKLEKLKTEYEKKKEQIIEIKDKIKQYKTITEIFSDTGIRKYIIKKYIEIINEFMNEFLDKFDLDIKFKIDENFDEVINSRFHKKFKYENFSEGEKKRIDLSLLFAILKFNSMRKGNKTNILILDEIIAGLDNISENNFYYILRTSDFLKDKCIYIISHSKGIDSTIFDRIYEVKKEKKFSKIIEK